jgi:hypothetical protein
MTAAGAATLVLALAGISQASPGQGTIAAHDMSSHDGGHGQSRGDEDSARDSQKDQNKDSYDGSEFEGDNESSNKNDETLIDVDALNTPDE